jgi:ABC-type transport system involved in cytochrome bd biosynthesis fused ATPase/permease subunit
MELRQKANECFGRLHDSGSHEIPALLIEAQFYMDEIERRKQDKVAKRDFMMELLAIGLEIIVILLIVLELVEGGKQSKALDAVANSANATAASVSSLQKEQEDTLRIQTETLHAIEKLNAARQTDPKSVGQKTAANR